MSSVRIHRTGYNETLPLISQAHYGTPNFGGAIYDANRSIIGTDPNHLNPGQDLVIPHIGV